MKNTIYLTIIIITLMCTIGCKTQNIQQNQPLQIDNIYERESDGGKIYYYADTPMDSLSNSTIDFDDTGNGVFGRKIIKRNWRALFRYGDPKQREGKVAIKLCVNRDGIVIYAETIPEECSITDSNFLKTAVNAAKGYRVQAKNDTYEIECGKLIFDLNINSIR